ncbi:MAG: hypothetical protein ACXAC8_14860 [Candidatus Hodarchaeales archaeon]
MVNEQPIFVETYFKTTPKEINQTIYFYYYDSSKNYLHLKETGAIKGELESIQANLQYWIDLDDLFINKKKVSMMIQDVSLEFQRNDPMYPYLIFNVKSSSFQLNRIKNEIHLYSKPEKINYPAISCWEFSSGNITSVISSSFMVISSNKSQVIFYLTKNEIVGGHERIFLTKYNDYNNRYV